MTSLLSKSIIEKVMGMGISNLYINLFTEGRDPLYFINSFLTKLSEEYYLPSLLVYWCLDPYQPVTNKQHSCY